MEAYSEAFTLFEVNAFDLSGWRQRALADIVSTFQVFKRNFGYKKLVLLAVLAIKEGVGESSGSNFGSMSDLPSVPR